MDALSTLPYLKPRFVGRGQSDLRSETVLRYLARHVGLTALLTPLMRTWHYVLCPDDPGPSPSVMQAYYRRYRTLLQEDLANARAGRYPRELLDDFPLGRYARMLPYGVVEFPSIYRRRAKKQYVDLPQIENRERYPHYYLRNFHWQSDGWMSDRSARLYDFSVEALFVGTASIMRRMAIPPLVESLHVHQRPAILDVACGTGQFLGQLRRTLPQAELTGIDLSPYYLARASRIGGVKLVNENAEAMPFPEASFDAVTSIFLFHELPKSARVNVMREMHRVAKPGARAIICDSAQRSESEELSYFFEAFPALYHEPYFKSYVADPLEDTMAELGFRVLSVRPHFLSKVVVAEKV
jgi:ubiquinone/menaquinone biosynthesis C-methylase UbiE